MYDREMGLRPKRPWISQAGRSLTRAADGELVSPFDLEAPGFAGAGTPAFLVEHWVSSARSVG